VYWEEREPMFIDRILLPIADKCRQLRIVVEHLSTEHAVHRVLILSQSRGYIFGNISTLHLTITANYIIGGQLKPQHFCKTIAKRNQDRQALRYAAFHADRLGCFGLGNDSAAHERGKKECSEGCAGAFVDFAGLPKLVELFEGSDNYFRGLRAFISDN